MPARITRTAAEFLATELSGRPAGRAPRPDRWAAERTTSLRRCPMRAAMGFLASATGGQESRQRAGQRCERSLVVDFFLDAAGETALGALAGALGTSPIDLF